MKSIKKLFCAALSLMFCLMLCACGNNPAENDHETYEEDGQPQNTAAEIYDDAGKKLGEIRQNGSATIYEEGILYTALSGKDRTEYRIYSPENGSDILLGAQDSQSYEAAYSRLKLRGKIYTLAMTGNLYDTEKDPLWLLELDPAGGLQRYLLSENGFPYVNMTSFGEKLLIFIHDQGETMLSDRVLEFDPELGELREVIEFTLQNELRGDSLRGVCESDGKLLLLRLHFESDADVSLWMDEYKPVDVDENGESKTIYEKKNESEITSLIRTAAENCGVVSQDVLLETEQPVAFFSVADGRYLWYENFSITHCLADLENGTVFSESDPFLSIGQGSVNPVFWRSFGGSDGKDRYLYRLVSGTLEKAELPFVGDGEMVVSACFAENGTGLFAVSSNGKVSGQRLIVSSADF